jgi:uncharacterized DUF497 family protein
MPGNIGFHLSEPLRFFSTQEPCRFDDEHSEREDRWITLGLDRAAVLLVVCHTFREEKEVGRAARAKIRLISARRADRRESAEYRGVER